MDEESLNMISSIRYSSESESEVYTDFVGIYFIGLNSLSFTLDEPNIKSNG